MKRNSSEINAGSMADIAFLLLIFFLVSTTMDVDQGITRKLSPWDDGLKPKSSPINQRNIFTVLLNSNNQLMVEGEQIDLADLRSKAKAFINNNGDGSCAYCTTGQELSTSSDHPEKAIISLQNDRLTAYESYVAVQNELAAAYTELRNELAMQRYGLSLDQVSDLQMDKIKKCYPQLISEAEPLSF